MIPGRRALSEERYFSPYLHANTDELDELSSLLVDDVDANHSLRLPFDDQFVERLLSVPGQGVFHRSKGRFVHVNLALVQIAGLCFKQSAVAQGRGTEDDCWDQLVVHFSRLEDGKSAERGAIRLVQGTS